jgi:hypothetical protein
MKSQMLTLETYDSLSDLVEYIEYCLKVWEILQLPSHLWVHHFFHSLGTFSKSWYVHKETRRQTACWKVLQD